MLAVIPGLRQGYKVVLDHTVCMFWTEDLDHANYVCVQLAMSMKVEAHVYEARDV